jgi:hypothetical protein
MYFFFSHYVHFVCSSGIIVRWTLIPPESCWLPVFTTELWYFGSIVHLSLPNKFKSLLPDNSFCIAKRSTEQSKQISSVAVVWLMLLWCFDPVDRTVRILITFCSLWILICNFRMCSYTYVRVQGRIGAQPRHRPSLGLLKTCWLTKTLVFKSARLRLMAMNGELFTVLKCRAQKNRHRPYSDNKTSVQEFKFRILGSECQTSGTCARGQSRQQKKTTPRLACVFWTT